MSSGSYALDAAEAAVEHARLRRDQSVLKLTDAEARLAQLRDEPSEIASSVHRGHFEGHDCARQRDNDTSDVAVSEAQRAFQIVLEFGVDRESVCRSAVTDGADKLHAAPIVEGLNSRNYCCEGFSDIAVSISTAEVSLKFSGDREFLVIDFPAEKPFDVHVTSPVVVGGTLTVGDGRVPGIRIEISGTCGKAVAS